MDTIKRRKLQTHREAIVQDLDVYEIINDLQVDGILTDNEVSNILFENGRQLQARHLLDLLSSKGPLAYESLASALKPYYPWLAEKLNSSLDCQASEQEERVFSDALLLGGLPSPPQHNVDRDGMLAELRSKLAELRRGRFVVLHSMAGSGKSCLAAQALNDVKLLMETFKGCVYWLDMGDVTKDELLSPMVQLLEKMSATSKKQWKYDVPGSVTAGTVQLRSAFTEAAFRDGLLILDDVTAAGLVDAFDVGCKTLVTTKDLNFVKGVKGRDVCITVQEGFKKKESLQLLANCVGVQVNDLPQQATTLHHLCKGMPLVLALIGAQLAENREDVRRNNGRWEFYINKLTSRDYRNLRRDAAELNQSGLLGAIGLSVDSLSDELRGYYFDFALFVEDVNIMPEVLQTLWRINKYEVEDHMVELMKKSLAVSKWNQHLNSYVYGIHDLLLYYLKEQLSDQEKQNLHKKLLARYREVCAGKFADLPTNDNYIFSYLGYHLSQAQEWQTFKTLYFDLEFLGAKLKNSGVGDLLVDIRKYRTLITGGMESVEEMLDDYKAFVHLHGLDLNRYPDLDIVQCALQQPRRSHVYKEALRIVNQRRDRLYMELLLDHDTSTQPTTLPLKQEVVAACFATRNRVLVANGGGFINLWDMDFGQILYTFRGHTEPVVYLELCPDRRQFLSASEDSSVKLWSLDNIVCQDSSEQVYDQYGCALKTPSPRMRQNSWSNMWGNGDGKVDTSVRSLAHDAGVRHATYSHDGLRAVSCAENLKIWTCVDGVPTLSIPTPDLATTCAFSSDDSLVFFASHDSVFAHNAYDGKFLFMLRNPGQVINILPIHDCFDRLVVTCTDSVQLWSLDDLLPTEICRSREGNHISSRLTQDGCRVVVCDTAHTITAWDVDGDGAAPVREYQDHSSWVRCLDTYWLEEGDHLVMSGSDDRTIKVWRLEEGDDTRPPSKLRPQFHAVWPPGMASSVPLLAALGATGVQVLHGRKLVTEVPCGDASACRLSADGRKLAYGRGDGCVHLVDACPSGGDGKPTGGDGGKPILTLDGSVHYLQFLPQECCTLVAATATMWQIWKEDVGCVFTAPLNYLVQCFTMALKRLITCSQDGTVKMWDNDDRGQLLLFGNESIHVTSAALRPTQDLLAMTDATGQLHLVVLGSVGTDAETQLFQLERSPSAALRACAFTADSRMLAVGHDSGAITLWDLETRSSLATLSLHKSWVRSLATSATHPGVLVSVGDVVAFWDLRAVCQPRRRRKSDSRRNRLSLEPIPDPNDIWYAKRGSSAKPELLGCVKLAGSHAERLDATPDWTVFTTVDSAGTVYHMKPFSRKDEYKPDPFRIRLRGRLSPD